MMFGYGQRRDAASAASCLRHATALRSPPEVVRVCQISPLQVDRARGRHSLREARLENVRHHRYSAIRQRVSGIELLVQLFGGFDGCQIA